MVVYNEINILGSSIRQKNNSTMLFMFCAGAISVQKNSWLVF